jgi:CubicO group peptidase (beta-lactamase class C family)
MHGKTDRRTFLLDCSVMAAGAAATGVPALITRPGHSAPVRSSKRAEGWIPSDAVLAKLPVWMELASVPAVSMAVVEGGDVVWSRAVGMRDRTTGVAVDESTMFEAASLSKPCVAYVAMLLRAEGRLDLDRPLADILAPADVARADSARRVTPRHVLSHSSGFRNWRRTQDAAWAPMFEPGSRFM